MNTRVKTAVSATMLALVAGLTLSACEEEGPAEQLGESIDESAEELGDAVEDATD